jgi:hypothetical protein
MKRIFFIHNTDDNGTPSNSNRKISDFGSGTPPESGGADDSFWLNNVHQDSGYGFFSSITDKSATNITMFLPPGNATNWNKNLIVNTNGHTYPAAAIIQSATWDTEVFVNYSGGDFTLKPGNPGKYAATDSTDVGVDMSALNAATGGTVSGVWDGSIPAPTPTPTLTPTPTPIPTPGPSPNPTPAPADFIWVEDSTPAGAELNGNRESWNWISSNPGPFGGTAAHQSGLVSGYHQHYFEGTSNTLSLNGAEKLFVYVYLDPSNVPNEIMLQWKDDQSGWLHRAYWGSNTIALGIDGTDSQRYMGPLPVAGQWVRLEVPANQVGLVGKTINGMAFTLYGGRATWDDAGKTIAAATGNPIDDPQTFVREHYLDFLNREPDSGGLGYWADQILTCAPSDAACIRSKRINISAAFFIELEFQNTGSFVYRFYKSSLGRRPSFAEFMPDRAQIVADLDLEANKQAFADAWVQRPEFLQHYPADMSGSLFIDALLQMTQQSSGLDLSSLQLPLMIDWNINQSRARIVRLVADSPAFVQSEYNGAFVVMQYFGYLRRDPDQGGYGFWLSVLNTSEQNNYRGMVCAFVTSAEYQLRFGSNVTHTNAECGP